MFTFTPKTWDQVKAYDTIVFNVEVDPTRKPRLRRMVLTSAPYVFKDAHAVETGQASLTGYHVTKSGARNKAYRSHRDDCVTTRISRVISVSRHGDAPAEVAPAVSYPVENGKTFSSVLGRKVAISAPMQRLLNALTVHGDVDTIRDGGTVGTVIALIDRGILRERTALRHGRGHGHHFPATTPAQVWDEAWAEHNLRIDAEMAPRFPEGTPEYAAYAAELRTELDKWVAGEAPYDANDVAAR